MDNNFEKPRKTTRRDFLAGGLGGAAATAAVIGVATHGEKIVDQIKNLGPKEIIETHEGIGSIVKKTHTPAEIHKSFPIGPKSVLGEILRRMDDKAEAWGVEVKIDGRNLKVPVSKQQFDTFIEGHEYKIVYKNEQNDQQGWVDSIEGLKIKY
jgi:hypothetical protein